MRSVEYPARKQKGRSEHPWALHPSPDGFVRVFRYFELYRPVSFALNDGHAVAHPVSVDQIGDLESDKVATPQLAIDRQIEHRQIPEVASQFEPGPNGPDLLGKQWAFLTNQSPLVPRRTLWLDSGELNFGHEFSSIHPSRSMRLHRVDQLILRKKSNGRFRNRVRFKDAVLPQGSSEPNVPNAAGRANDRSRPSVSMFSHCLPA